MGGPNGDEMGNVAGRLVVFDAMLLVMFMLAVVTGDWLAGLT